MRVAQINLYLYDELSPEAQKNARHWWRSGYDNVFLEPMADKCKASLNKIGFNIERVEYSISYTQHDFAGFVGEFFYPSSLPAFNSEEKDLEEFFSQLTKMNEKAQEPIFAKFHLSNFGNLVFDDYNHDDIPAIFRGIARWLYRKLRNEMDFQLADSTVAEILRVNRYEFTESGERWTD